MKYTGDKSVSTTKIVVHAGTKKAMGANHEVNSLKIFLDDDGAV